MFTGAGGPPQRVLFADASTFDLSQVGSRGSRRVGVVAGAHRLYHSWKRSPVGTLRVMSTIMVSLSQRFTNGCLRTCPYMNSSENSIHGYSMIWAFDSKRR